MAIHFSARRQPEPPRRGSHRRRFAGLWIRKSSSAISVRPLGPSRRLPPRARHPSTTTISVPARREAQGFPCSRGVQAVGLLPAGGKISERLAVEPVIDLAL